MKEGMCECNVRYLDQAKFFSPSKAGIKVGFHPLRTRTKTSAEKKFLALETGIKVGFHLVRTRRRASAHIHNQNRDENLVRSHRARLPVYTRLLYPTC